MKKKTYIIIIILVILVLATVVASTKRLNKIKETYTNKELNEKTEDVTSDIINTDLTYEKFTKIIGQNVPNVHIPVGPNSYLRNKPEDKLIKKYNLENYVKEQEELVKKVEKRYLDNLNYEILGTVDKDGESCQIVKITSYYYALYLNDFINLTNNLLDKDLADIVTSEKTQIEYYKVHVAALKILDNHLDDYENKEKESVEVTVCYVNGKIKSSDEMLGFILSLQGERYSNMDFSKEINIKRSDERLAKYIEEAKQVKIS